jgi:hypothetical protein
VSMTLEHYDALHHLERYAADAFRSKRRLRILDDLSRMGYIVFMPLDGVCTLTKKGEEALSR